MSIKQQTINLEVFHFEANLNSDMTFTISFWGKREKGSDKNRVRVNMTFKLYWLKHFKSNFKSVANNALDIVVDSGFVDD